MNKITIVIPKNKARLLDKTIKTQEINKFIKLKDAGLYKYELIVTDLQTQELLNLIKEKLQITQNKPANEGYITINETNLITPYVEEKGKRIELDELILKGAKEFIKLDRNYILFTICASIIACLGFQIDSVIVLIGAMLISPVMAPIMAASYGMSRANQTLVWKGIKNELVAVGLIISVSFVMSFIPNTSTELETVIAGSNVFFALFLAMIIGVVGANSFVTGHSETLTGVAVSISLLPPLTNAVLLLMSGLPYHSINALFSFIFNILGMHLSALIFFLIIKKIENKKGINEI